MADIKGFTKSIQKKYGVRPVVPFEQALKIGDIGRIGPDQAWEPVSTLRQRFGVVPRGVRNTRSGEGVWEVQSGSEVSFKAYAAGETSQLVSTVGAAKARAEISFGKSKSFLMAAQGVTIRSATNLDDVTRSIRKAYKLRNGLPEDRRWDEDLCFVFALGGADSYTAMIADSKNAQVAVYAKAAAGLPPAEVVDLAAGVRFGHRSSDLMKVSQTNASGRFFRAYRLKPSIFKRWDEESIVEVRYSIDLSKEANFARGGPKAESVDDVYTEI